MLDISDMDGIYRLMDEFGSKPATKVGVLPIPGFALMSYASLVEPFRAANYLSRRTLYEVVPFSQGGAVESSGQARAEARHLVGEVVELDYLFVVAGGDPMGFEDPQTLSWLRRMARRGVPLGGVSGGPVILARAGLLEGRRLTVHWEHAAAMAETWPGLLIERSLYVIDRDRVTCAGGTAALDLTHALIARDHGQVFAQLVSDWFLHTDIRPSGGPQRGGLVERVGTNSAPVLDAVALMETHLADPLALGDLARAAGVTQRQLNRLFQDRLGQSTMAYYRDLRLALAHRLLTGSTLPVTEIALAAGFSTPSHFSSAYAARYGQPPSKARLVSS